MPQRLPLTSGAYERLRGAAPALGRRHPLVAINGDPAQGAEVFLDCLAIAVSALDHLDQRASFSNFGPRIDVGAPGGGDAGAGFDPFRSILSLRSSGAGVDMTGDGNLVVSSDYLRQAGTSMAAPHVAGAAAVVLSAHPGYGPGQVHQALRAGADDVGAPGVDADSGFGRINVASAVGLDVLDVDLGSPTPSSTATGSQLVVTGTAAGASFASYRLDYGAGAFPTVWTTFAGPVTTPVLSDQLGVWNINLVEDGAYVLRVVATNTSGTEFEARVPLTLDRQILTFPVPSTIQRLTGPIPSKAPPPAAPSRASASNGASRRPTSSVARGAPTAWRSRAAERSRSKTRCSRSSLPHSRRTPRSTSVW